MRCSPVTLFSLPLVAASVVVPLVSAAVTLEALRWERRLVVAFGDAPVPFATLERLVAERVCELAERDVDVYRVTDDDVLPFSPHARPLERDARATLVTLMSSDGTGGAGGPSGVGEGGFALLLIGKDGGVKRRAVTPEALGGFLDAIDAMPMRRAEAASRDDGSEPCP